MKSKLNIDGVIAGSGKLVADIGVIAGAAGVTYGAWLFTHPLGYIVGGVLLSVGSFLAGYDRSRVRSVK